MGDTAKGTITSLDSLFSPEEAWKAARRVEDAIADRRKELDRLRGFLSDNSALIHLVRKLPDELSHDIMVPFGSAAFSPGRLIHTNEFLVLLGEGYYADRTAKQTIEILQRRGKALEAQVDSLKATMLDLQLESKFFNSTAAEAAEGLVEIREEYVEDTPKDVFESGISVSNPPDASKEDNLGKPDEDEVHARIMAKLDELEKEEIEDGSASGSDEDAEDSFQSNVDDDKNEASEIANLSMQFSGKAASFQSDREQPHSIEKSPLPPEPKENLHQASVLKLEDSSENSARQTFKIGSSSRRAFTGSIVEHSHGLAPIQSTKSTIPDQASGSNPSKPVSRFKMQKGIR
ncbi:uncharacterized protein [Elaeis guineensis]|uniref:RNA polymerase II subunit 5-mediating protein homolog n=1 Tax=Elaeis guineensis var. tenera TaxID=51953 RepID=A0A6I9RID3_ELAGV|nr:RNA polymerase II subunit 5-mediating protein homolog [Elaeis guineensis]